MKQDKMTLLIPDLELFHALMYFHLSVNIFLGETITFLKVRIVLKISTISF